MKTGGSGTPGRALRAVAVVSDGSDFHGEPGSTVLTGLLTRAALLREQAGVSATALLVSGESSAEEFIAELRRMTGEFSAIYLVHTDAARGRNAQTALSGTLPVITDRQTTAVAAVAATLTTLARVGVTLAAGHAVIVGAERDPLVAALAVAAGIGEIDSWGLDDAYNFPLHVLARHVTVVIDLLGSAAQQRLTDAVDSPPPVIAVEEPTTPLLALPGLLAAVEASGRAPGLALCLACAQALADRTPADRILPVLSDLGLAAHG